MKKILLGLICGVALAAGFVSCGTTAGFDLNAYEVDTQEMHSAYVVPVFKGEGMEEFNLALEKEKGREERFRADFAVDWEEWSIWQGEYLDEGEEVPPFVYETTAQVYYGGKGNRYVSVLFDNWCYGGGAHGNYAYISENWDLVEGRFVNVMDVTGLTAEEISALCERQIRTILYEDVPDEEYESSFKDWVMAGCDPLYVGNMDFFVDKKRVVVIFDPYEVAAYAYGAVGVELPIKK